MNVFVVYWEVIFPYEPGEYGIEGVFSTEEKAREYIEILKKNDALLGRLPPNEDGDYGRVYDVEEFDLDD